jgi:hypothetical protein
MYMRFLRYLFVVLIVVCFLPMRAFAAADPVAYWKFDDGSGTAPIDSSGNNITGSFLSPNPTWSTDVPSDISFSDPYSLDFTGYHDGVTFAWPSGLNFSSTAPRSFSFWYKPTADGEPDAGSFDRILSWDSDAFEIAGTFGNIATHEIAFYDGSWRDTGYALTVGTWYHITFTYDGTRARFYVGNDLKYNQAEGGRALSGTMAVGTRQNGHNEGINGRIDDVRVYDYALDFTQIQNLTAGSSNPDSAPTTPTPSPTITPTGGPTSVPGSSSTTSSSTSSTCDEIRPVGVPDLFQISTSRTTATVFFAPLAGVSSYTISYGLEGGATDYAVSASFASDGAQSYTINALSPGTTYYFKVRGGDSCMPGGWSSVQSGTTIGRSSSDLFPSLGTRKQARITKITTQQAPTVAPTIEVEKQDLKDPIQSRDVLIHLTHDGQPLVDAEVELHSIPRYGRTNEKGDVLFSHVENGDHIIKIAYKDYATEQKLAIAGDAKQYDVSINVELKQQPFSFSLLLLIGGMGLIIGILLYFILRKRKMHTS